MSIDRRTARRTLCPTADDLLNEALEQAKLAYRFSPSSYTFDAMRAVMSAIKALRAPDSDSTNGTGPALSAGPGKAAPG